MKIIIHPEDSAVKECVTTSFTFGKSNKFSKEDPPPSPNVKFVELEMINFHSHV
jgi:hypothetical protein